MELQASTTPNCTKDWIHIYDGETNQTRLLRAVCDSYTPSMMTSTSNRLLIVFHSDFFDQARGFNVSYVMTGRLINI